MVVPGRPATQRCPACGAQVENMSEHLESVHPEDPSQVEEGQDRRPLATGPTPWGMWTLLLISIFFSFGAAGTVAALNWRRLGRRDLFVPTLLIAIGGMLAFNFFVLAQIDLASNQVLAVRLLADAGAAGAFWYWQRTTYRWWNLNFREAGRAGTGVPLLVCLAWALVRSIPSLF